MSTIVAPATALVEQPIGIIRVSGPEAYQIGIQQHLKQLEIRKVYTSDIGLTETIDKAVVIFISTLLYW